MRRKIDTKKIDRDKMDRHLREGNAAIIEIARLQHEGKSGAAMRDAERARERHVNGLMREITKPRGGVLDQLMRDKK